MLAGEPDSCSWLRSNILVSESSDGGSAARAAPRQILTNPEPSCWVRRADATYAAPGDRTT
jgi:hypothetical protein